jgi:hypothetical protein
VTHPGEDGASGQTQTPPEAHPFSRGGVDRTNT